MHIKPIDQLAISYHHIGRAGTLDKSPDTPGIMSVFNEAFPHGGRSLRDFRNIIAQNENNDIQRQWHRARYDIVYAKNTFRDGSQKVVGVAMFETVPSPRGERWDNRFDLAIFGDYRAVDPGFWRKGIASRLARFSGDIAETYVKHIGNVPEYAPTEKLYLNESAMPDRMPLLHYLQDLFLVGQEPVDRVIGWKNMGYRRLAPNWKIPLYLQPRSASGDIECRYYSLNARLPDGDFVYGTTIADILKPCVAMRLNNGNPCTDDGFQEMIDNFNHAGKLRPMDDRPLLSMFKDTIYEVLKRIESMPEEHWPLDDNMASIVRDFGHRAPLFA